MTNLLHEQHDRARFWNTLRFLDKYLKKADSDGEDERKERLYEFNLKSSLGSNFDNGFINLDDYIEKSLNSRKWRSQVKLLTGLGLFCFYRVNNIKWKDDQIVMMDDYPPFYLSCTDKILTLQLGLKHDGLNKLIDKALKIGLLQIVSREYSFDRIHYPMTYRLDFKLLRLMITRYGFSFNELSPCSVNIYYQSLKSLGFNPGFNPIKDINSINRYSLNFNPVYPFCPPLNPPTSIPTPTPYPGVSAAIHLALVPSAFQDTDEKGHESENNGQISETVNRRTMQAQKSESQNDAQVNRRTMQAQKSESQNDAQVNRRTMQYDYSFNHNVRKDKVTDEEVIEGVKYHYRHIWDKYVIEDPGFKFRPKVTRSKDGKKSLVTKISIRETCQFANTERQQRHALLESVYGEYYEYDVKSSIFRVNHFMNVGDWLDENVDFYFLMSPYGYDNNEEREMIKRLFMRFYFASSPKDVKTKINNYLLDEKRLEKIAASGKSVDDYKKCVKRKGEDIIWVVNLIFDNMRQVIGETFSNEIFLHESCIYRLVRHKLQEMGVTVNQCYDCFYTDKKVDNMYEIIKECGYQYRKDFLGLTETNETTTPIINDKPMTQQEKNEAMLNELALEMDIPEGDAKSQAVIETVEKMTDDDMIRYASEGIDFTAITVKEDKIEPNETPVDIKDLTSIAKDVVIKDQVIQEEVQSNDDIDEFDKEWNEWYQYSYNAKTGESSLVSHVSGLAL